MARRRLVARESGDGVEGWRDPLGRAMRHARGPSGGAVRWESEEGKRGDPNGHEGHLRGGGGFAPLCVWGWGSVGYNKTVTRVSVQRTTKRRKREG